MNELIAIIGDTHFGRKAENPVVKKKLMEGQRAYFEHLKDWLSEKGIKTVLFTGDLHDTRTTVNVESLISTLRLMRSVLKDFDKHVVLGNHDLYYENSYDVSLLEAFDGITGLTIHRTSVEKLTLVGRTWYFVPWVLQDNEPKFRTFLEKLATNPLPVREKTVLFGHFEMFGVDMEGGSLSTFGLDPNLFLNAAGLTLSGHYHGKSDTVKSGATIRYVGSPYPLTFANAGDVHGIWTMDADGEMEFFENAVSPKFADVWDTDPLDSFGDLSNSFVRFYISNSHSSEEEFALRLSLESKKPLLIIPIPYSGTKEEVAEKAESEREATRIMGMDTYRLSEMYIDRNSEALPKLKLSSDPKAEILSQITEFANSIK